MKYFIVLIFLFQQSLFSQGKIIFFHSILNFEGVSDEKASLVTDNILKSLDKPEIQILQSTKKSLKSISELKKIASENNADIVLNGTVRVIDSVEYIFLYKYINGEKNLVDFKIKCIEDNCKNSIDDIILDEILFLPDGYVKVEKIPESEKKNKISNKLKSKEIILSDSEIKTEKKHLMKQKIWKKIKQVN